MNHKAKTNQKTPQSIHLVFGGLRRSFSCNVNNFLLTRNPAKNPKVILENDIHLYYLVLLLSQ